MSHSSRPQLQNYCALTNTFLAQTLIGKAATESTQVLQSLVKKMFYQAFAIGPFLADRRLEAATG